MPIVNTVDDLSGYAKLSGASFTGPVSVAGDAYVGGNLLCTDFKITTTWLASSANSYVMVSNGGGTWVRLRSLADLKTDLGVDNIPPITTADVPIIEV